MVTEGIHDRMQNGEIDIRRRANGSLMRLPTVSADFFSFIKSAS